MMQESRFTNLQRKQVNECLKSKFDTFGWEVGGCSMVIICVVVLYYTDLYIAKNICICKNMLTFFLLRNKNPDDI